MTTTHVNAPAQSRSLLDSLSRLGTGLISFFARVHDSSGGYGGGAGGTTGGSGGGGQSSPTRPGDYSSEQEPPPTPGEMACCQLAFPNGPFCEYTGRRQDYVCPDGWYRQWWHCCEGSRLAGCGECTRSQSTCWEGPFHCSMWWWTSQPC
jgi:hypothetical protein